MKNKLKILKNIIPDQKRKEEFREFLGARTTHVKPAVKLFSLWNLLKPLPIASLLLAVSLLGGGAVFASQSSLPGDILYPVKLGTEKIKIALANDNAKKASLHLEFASERLNELNQIIEKDKNVKDEQVDQVFAQYKTELDESEKILDQTTSQKPQIAAMIDEEMESDKKTITEMSEKIIKKEKDGKFKKHLKEAYEHAELKNDAATIAIFSTPSHQTISEEDILATSTTASLRRGLIRKSRDKIRSAEHIVEKIKSDGYGATNTEELIGEAKQFMEDKKYFKSFLKSKEAKETAQKAEESEDRLKENNENRDKNNNKEKDGNKPESEF